MGWSVQMLRVAGTTGTVQWLCLTSARSGPTRRWAPSLRVCVPLHLCTFVACGSHMDAHCNVTTVWSYTSIYFLCLRCSMFLCLYAFLNFSLYVIDSWADDGRYQCDVGWQNFQAGCYWLNTVNLDWNSAHKTCQKMEANLVSIHTLPELEFITKHMKTGNL